MTHKIIIPRAGQNFDKVSWAKSWVNKDLEHRVRFSQDDIKSMLGWDSNKESLIKAICLSFLNEAMLKGYDIVLDSPSQEIIDEVREIIEEFNEWISLSPVNSNYIIEYVVLFGTPLEEYCV